MACHKIVMSISEGTCASLLNFGPVARILELNKNDNFGNSYNVNTGYCRVVHDKIFLPNDGCTWEVVYETKPIDIGPLERITVFKVADAYANGEYYDSDKIRKMLKYHKPHAQNRDLNI